MNAIEERCLVCSLPVSEDADLSTTCNGLCDVCGDIATCNDDEYHLCDECYEIPYDFYERGDGGEDFYVNIDTYVSCRCEDRPCCGCDA